MIDTIKLRELQTKIAKQVVISDSFKKIRLVTGFDSIFAEKKVLCAAVTQNYKSLDVIEKSYHIDNEAMPYIPTFLAFREGPPILSLYNKLEHKPDVILIDGHGILHPYKAGLATFVGVTLNIATIGIGKSFLCGDVKENIVYVSNEPRGFKLITKHMAKPVYISPGHNVNLKTSVKIVKHLIRGHKLPEPLRLAHKYADKLKKQGIMKD